MAAEMWANWGPQFPPTCACRVRLSFPHLSSLPPHLFFFPNLEKDSPCSPASSRELLIAPRNTLDAPLQATQPQK